MSSNQRSSEERRAAFEATVLPLMKVVYNRAIHLTRNRESSADLVQETYLRAYRTFDNFEPGTNARAWLFTILYSVFVSAHRRQRREPDAVALEEADHLYTEATAAMPALDPKTWASEEVHAALDQIPADFRTVLLMVDVDELTYEETAAALGCPVGTVRSRLSRARQALYIALERYARAHGLMKGRS